MSKRAFLPAGAGDKTHGGHDGLSADEETELSKRILAGEAAKNTLSNSKQLGAAEQAALEKTVEEGRQAYDRLVLANQPRAAKIAAEAFRKNPYGLNEYEDYLQTALKVICSCAKTYDWRLGCRFGTYVHQCLSHEMIRENARNGYSMRIPEENLTRLTSLKRKAETEGLDKAAKELGMTGIGAAKLLLAGSFNRSLQAPVNDDDPETDLGETIADARAVTAEEIETRIDHEAMLGKLSEAFSALPEEERTLLKGRMGIEGDTLPMKAFVGTIAKSISGVQKKQIAAERHLREIYFSLPMAD